MGNRKPLTVKEQTEQLRLIEEKVVSASLRKLRLNVAKLKLKAKLEKGQTSKPLVKFKKDKPNRKELKQIKDIVKSEIQEAKAQ